MPWRSISAAGPSAANAVTATSDLILYVDDEEASRKYFRIAFSRHYQVLTAADAIEALEVVGREGDRIALVVSDQRMPGRSGIELLTEIEQRYPRILRLLTSAYTDLSEALAAVNQGVIHAFVNKPWNVEELQLVIRRALEYQHLRRERDSLAVEKHAICQNLLFSDRLQGLGLMATVSSGWLRQPLRSTMAFWRDSYVSFAASPSFSGLRRDLWEERTTLSRRLIEHGHELGGWLARLCGHPPTALDQGGLAARLLAANPDLRLGRNLGTSTLQVEAELLIAGLTSFLQWLSALVGGRDVRIGLDLEGSAQGLELRLEIAGPGRAAATEVDDLAGLEGYLVLGHHHATVRVGTWRPEGGQVTVAIPMHQEVVEEGDGQSGFLALLTGQGFGVPDGQLQASARS